MLKELFNLVKGNATDSVINNPDVPNEHNDAVVAEATNTVASGMQNIVAGGGLNSLLSLFRGDGTNRKSLLSNPIVSMMMGHFAGKLMNKFNLNNTQANNLSGSLIPNVLGSLISKTNDPNDSNFTLEKLIGSITGNKSGNVNSNENTGSSSIGDLLKQFTGDETGNGKGLMDIIKNLAGGAQRQQQQNGNGGLMNLINGFVR
jgi:hypothetical protein